MTRKVGECIVIGDDVVVTVVRLAGGMVRLGIEAPADYSVMREELLRGGARAGGVADAARQADDAAADRPGHGRPDSVEPSSDSSSDSAAE